VQKKTPKSFLGKSFLDIYFCPFLDSWKKFWEF